MAGACSCSLGFRGSPKAEIDDRPLFGRGRETGLTHLQQAEPLFELDGHKILGEEVAFVRLARVVTKFHRAVFSVIIAHGDDLMELLQIGLLSSQQIAQFWGPAFLNNADRGFVVLQNY